MFFYVCAAFLYVFAIIDGIEIIYAEIKAIKLVQNFSELFSFMVQGSNVSSIT